MNISIPALAALAALAIMVTLVSLATGCSDKAAILYSHDDSAIRLDEQNRLVIDAGQDASAVIDSQYRLFVGGSRVALNSNQQALVTRYYDSVTRIRKDGWKTGRAGASFALQTLKTVASKIAAGEIDTIGQSIESQKQTLLASVDGLCETFAQALTAQQRLASNVPDFRAYTVIDVAYINHCQNKVAENRASH